MTIDTIRLALAIITGCSGCVAVVAGSTLWYLRYPLEMNWTVYNSFAGDTFNVPGLKEPMDLGNGIVMFPREWSDDQRATWRKEHNSPGPEWGERAR